MFIRPLSDVHNEFSTFNVPATDVDSMATLVLAGDIGVAKRPNTLHPFLEDVSKRFANVLYIPGNHEYYNDGSLLRTEAKLADICAKYPNVHYMNRQTRKIDDVLYIGATLWTDFKKGDPIVMLQAGEELNDYEHIRTGTHAEPYRRTIRPIDIIGIHLDHRSFIETELKKAKLAGEKKVVVFTHHGPSFMSRPKEMRPTNTDWAYYNDCGLEDMMLDYGVSVWIHGHSHYPVDYLIGDTRVVSNPRGYAYHGDKTERSDFSGSLVIEL